MTFYYVMKMSSYSNYRSEAPNLVVGQRISVL